ncbi:hypothetical protein JZ751_008073 [Albula glossodonta]|uniref:Proline-rich protein 15-like protein A n=1 Tax=Albula glossodonta TaxID=121402 RepID=A0A8T2P9Q1_9TELE|nr:hypothetical protein JZ751_008073 [Albula glossodonta]
MSKAEKSRRYMQSELRKMQMRCKEEEQHMGEGLAEAPQVQPHVLTFSAVMADPSTGWWKLTFLRKKKSEAKVLYEIPPELSSNTGNKDPGAPTNGDPEDSQFNARLEKIVDKTATKGRHVKVSHSGRFKEKKKIRATLAENPNLFPEHSLSDENHRAEK